MAARERLGARGGEYGRTEMTERAFALATLEINVVPVPCVEIDGVAYLLAPATARIGTPDWPSLRALLEPRSHAPCHVTAPRGGESFRRLSFRYF